MHVSAPQTYVTERNKLSVDEIQDEQDPQDNAAQPDSPGQQAELLLPARTDPETRPRWPPGPRRVHQRHEDEEGEAELGHREDAEALALRAGGDGRAIDNPLVAADWDLALEVHVREVDAEPRADDRQHEGGDLDRRRRPCGSGAAGGRARLGAARTGRARGGPAAGPVPGRPGCG